jgi:VanZ family protein
VFLRYNILGIIWALAALPLFLLPGDDLPPMQLWGPIPFDSAVHVFIFAILAFLLIVGFVKQYRFRYFRLHPRKAAIFTALIYGMIIEVVQETLVPDRSFEISDLLANFVGCLGGSLTFNILYYKI